MGVGTENRGLDSTLLAQNGYSYEEEQRPLSTDIEVKGVEIRDQTVRADERGTWSRRLEFVLASVGYAVGLGNVWRFPYLCYRSGGGAFMIPYFTMLFLCGVPLLFMEFSIGQYTRLGPVHALAKVCPLLKGVGLSTVVISFVLCTYYNVLMAWALYYLFNSFQSPLPWQTCNSTWNIQENCSCGFPGNVTHLQSASQQFFDYRLLEKTGGIEKPGNMRWELFGILLLAWAIVYLCIFKGVKSTGKVVYFTVTFPYVILLALLINNVQLPGAKTGILYFVTPVWSKLLEVQVWVNAAAQIFNSIGIGYGSMISLASYNKFNNNILRDTLIVSMANSATSIFAGFVVFSAIGYMAHVHNLPVDDIATDGPGLVFVVYPEILSTMPVAQLWACLFFLMLLCLGLDSQFGMVEVIVTCIMDGFGLKLLKYLKRKEIVVLAVCAVGFIVGIPNITQGGIFVFQLMDHYTAVVSLMFMAFFEVVAVCWIFGAGRISKMVTRMIGRPPSVFFKVCWLVFSPLLVMCIFISSVVQYTPARYGKTYTYPVWAEVLGWFISLISIVWIPLGALHTIYYNEGTLLQRLKTSLLPRDELARVDDLSGESQPSSTQSLSLSKIPEKASLTGQNTPFNQQEWDKHDFDL